MIYVFEDIGGLDDDFWERVMPLLSEQRREKVRACRFPLGRNLSAAAYLLLRHALHENYDIDEAAEFILSNTGKPYLKEHPSIFFNLSHCKTAVACAVSKSEVGIDVQDTEPVSEAVARRVLTHREYDIYKAAPDPARKFSEFWTVKESGLKCSGVGIGVDLRRYAAEDVKDKILFGGKDYYGCAAGSGAADLKIKVLPSITDIR
jgi:4'-phosphopantetheinyl transferase